MADMHPDTATTPTHGRRQFLRLGGAGVVAAAVLAACTDDEVTPPSETGVTEPPTETTFAPPQTTSPADGELQNAAVMRTARSVELAMVEVYGTLLGTGGGSLELADPVTLDEDAQATLELIGERHQAHADALVGLIADAGGAVVVEPNNGVLEGLVTPRLAELTTEETVLQLCQTLEELAAGTYVWGTGTLSSAELREDLMAIGAVTARHSAALSMLLDPSGMSAVKGPVLDASGPARLPEYMLVLDGQDGGDTLAEPAPSAAEEDPEANPEEQEDSGAEEQDDDGPETPDDQPAETVPE